MARADDRLPFDGVQVHTVYSGLIPNASSTAFLAMRTSGDHSHSSATSDAMQNLIHIASDRVDQDILLSLKATPLARLYLRTLRRFPLFKSLDIFLWSAGIPKILIGARRSISFLRIFPFYPHGAVLTPYLCAKPSHYLEKTTLLNQEASVIPSPVVYQPRGSHVLIGPQNSVFPPIQCVRISQAFAYGGTNLLFGKHSVYCHDLYKFRYDYTGEELHGRHFLFAPIRRLYNVRPDPTPFPLAEAMACLDACAHNYAHFLTEVLPRINLFCNTNHDRSIPIIIDDGLHRNIVDAVRLIVGPERIIYQLPVAKSVFCQTLWTVTATGYVPFDQRNSSLHNLSQGTFSCQALMALRDHPAISALRARSDGELAPERIFVKRNSSVRKLINEPQIEPILAALGFISIDPQELSFVDQVRLFSHAKVVVGVTGAAMANAIFCQPGTQVAVLMPIHRHMIYGYWPAMLAPFGISTTYILGNIVANHRRGIHGDFYIKPDSLYQFLAAI